MVSEDNRECKKLVLLAQSHEELKRRASGRDTGKANHSDPYTRPPKGGCTCIYRLTGIIFCQELFDGICRTLL